MGKPILFVTTGSYDSYYCMGIFVGSSESLVLVRKELQIIFDEVDKLRKRWENYSDDKLVMAANLYLGKSSEEEMELYRNWRNKSDLLTTLYFEEIASKYNVKYIMQKDENTIHLEDV
jgi:hypothetical protein